MNHCLQRHIVIAHLWLFPPDGQFRLNATERVRLVVWSASCAFAAGDLVPLKVRINSTTVRPIDALVVSLNKVFEGSHEQCVVCA